MWISQWLGLNGYIFRSETCIEAYWATIHTAKGYIKRLYFSLLLLCSSILESSVTQWHMCKLHHTFTRLTRTKHRFFLHENGSSSCRRQREALTRPNIVCPVKKISFSVGAQSSEWLLKQWMKSNEPRDWNNLRIVVSPISINKFESWKILGAGHIGTN